MRTTPVWILAAVGVLFSFVGHAQEIGTDPFERGDVNGDSLHDISDPIHLLGYLLAGGDAPPCLDAADTNDDGAVNLADAVHGLNYIFSITVSTLPPPFVSPNLDPTLDLLACGCASADEIETLVLAFPTGSVCVPSFTVSLGITNATICSTSPPVCAGSNGCTTNITIQSASYDSANQDLIVTGTISAPTVPVSAGFLGSCTGNFNANYSVLITTTSVVLQPAARRITSFSANASVTNPQIGGCGLLGSALNLAAGLFADTIEQEIEDAVEAALNSQLDNLVVCAP